jgi:hypothetical protein
LYGRFASGFVGMFIGEIWEWMGLIMLGWKGLNMEKTSTLMWQRHHNKKKGL